MAATAKDIQTHLDNAVTDILKSTISIPYMIRNYGSDWKKWPKNSRLYMAMNEIATARGEVGQLSTAKLVADFAVE